MIGRPIIFQTPEVAKLLRASRFTLNRLMLRSDIRTSVGSRRGRGSRLLFTVEDVGKLALAYWLFRSGMRSPAIKDALAHERVEQLCKKLGGVDEIEEAATRWRFLITWRVAKGQTASQDVRLEKTMAGVHQILESIHQYGFVVVPLSRLLKELAEAIRKRQ